MNRRSSALAKTLLFSQCHISANSMAHTLYSVLTMITVAHTKLHTLGISRMKADPA